MFPYFSIVTVCLNEEKTIRRTIESVLAQSFKDYEMLIMDGQSNDNTLNIIDKLKNDSLRVYSSRDFGVYNAMNRGVAMANGKFVVFLNAGDELYSNDVLEKVKSYTVKDEDCIYYGNADIVSTNGESRIADYSKVCDNLGEQVMNGYMINHQAIYAPVHTLRNHYFSEQYKMRADYEWLVYNISERVKCIHMPIAVCKFYENGISSAGANIHRLHEETFEIKTRYKSNLVKDEKETDRKLEEAFEACNKYRHLFSLSNELIDIKQRKLTLASWFESNSIRTIAIYGMGQLGKLLLNELKGTDVNVDYAIDKNATEVCCENLKLYSIDELSLPDCVDAIVVTPICEFKEIESLLQRKVSVRIVSLEEIVNAVCSGC